MSYIAGNRPRELSEILHIAINRALEHLGISYIAMNRPLELSNVSHIAINRALERSEMSYIARNRSLELSNISHMIINRALEHSEMSYIAKNRSFELSKISHIAINRALEHSQISYIAISRKSLQDGISGCNPIWVGKWHSYIKKYITKRRILATGSKHIFLKNRRPYFSYKKTAKQKTDVLHFFMLEWKPL